MNSLTSRQRKIVFALSILVLLAPIVYLGAPLSEDVQPGTKTGVTGGRLARMRHEQELGESTLGNIDPSSAAANLMLLGLRGLAASVLHQSAIDYQERKDWGKLKTTVDSILLLQPHYVEVWKFQGWNLAFNVSREWDRVDDRFYWVKEGLKFLQKGTDRNQTATILFHNVGEFVGRKIGYSDEKKYFRRFFLSDPEENKYGGGADPVVNPESQDNYLVARDWFQKANELDDNYPVSGMTREFFRKSPTQALFDYATAVTSEGEFQNSIDAWAEASQEWREVFGNEIFEARDGMTYKLNSLNKPEELEEMAIQNGVTLSLQHHMVNQRVKMVNYTFWQQVADCEQDPVTVEARKAIYQGKQAYLDADLTLALELFEKGIAKTAEMLERHPQVNGHDDTIMNAMLAVLYWMEIHKLNGTSPPANYPLKQFVAKNRMYNRDVETMFLRETN
ncbi:MAG: hypothetical protein MK110_16825 [Fuerstiella sp.]|nr:hypothetical protein [Fuerstiella sp.]